MENYPGPSHRRHRSRYFGGVVKHMNISVPNLSKLLIHILNHKIFFSARAMGLQIGSNQIQIMHERMFEQMALVNHQI